MLKIRDTPRYAVIERAMGLARETPEQVYTYFWWKFNSEFVVIGDCMVSIFVVNDDDIASTRRAMEITPPTSGSIKDAFDKDDSTSANWMMDPNTTLELFIVDFEEAFNGLLRVHGGSWDPVNLLLYGSNDGDTWDHVFTGRIGYDVFIYAPGYRYYKAVFNNISGRRTLAWIWSFEAYPAHRAPYRRAVRTDTEKDLYVVAWGGRYHVFEIVRIN
jgi:hypothetical protein